MHYVVQYKIAVSTLHHLVSHNTERTTRGGNLLVYSCVSEAESRQEGRDVGSVHVRSLSVA